MIALLLMLACGEEGPTPPGDTPMVAISATPGGPGAFWIDQHEFPNKAGEKPTLYTDLSMAREGCAAVGKRVCTAAEWRRACSGPEGHRYGYGPTFEPGRCHSEDKLPSGHTSMMKPEQLVAASGAYPNCRTSEGVVDMPGNLEEWVLDDWKGMDGMLEGGAWYTLADYADCSGLYSRHPDYRLSTDKKVYSAGFRCCWTPAPPTEADIRADADARIGAARALSSTAPYAPENEVEVAPGRFMDTYEYPNRVGEVPVVGVTWGEARGLCEAAGKRLCSAKEWEDACAGPDRLPWPYGDRPVTGACATLGTGIAKSGHHLACVSPSGVHDLAGNVWEWTDTPLDAPVLAPPGGAALREIRGGSWTTDDLKATCLPRDGYPLAPEGAVFPDLGFRCCRGESEASQAAVKQPATLTCPAGMVPLDGYCIDRFEHPDHQFQPVLGNLDWDDAKAACAGVGKHVCTEAEWLGACEGPAHRRWPYGNVYVKDACQDSSDVAADRGGGATRAGKRTKCVTPEGVGDLSSNLWEWVERSSDPALGGRPRGVIRGGGWNISAGLGQCRAVFAPSPTYRAPELGVRCCASAAEAAALLAGGR